MNVRNGVGKEVKKCSSFVAAIIVVVTFLSVSLAEPTSATDGNQDSAAGSSNDTGIQVASWLLTIPYCAGKTAFAIAGSVVGGLGYAFSGGNTKTAESIWTSTVYGTYILRPAHLRGEEPIHFLGNDGEEETESVTHASIIPESERK